MDILKEFLRADKEKAIVAGAILIISIVCITIGIYGGFNYPILRIFFIAVSFFYLPVFFVLEIVYSIISSMRPDMDTMTASQFYFHFGLMFVLGCVYVYLVSSIIVFVHRRKYSRYYFLLKSGGKSP
ncbi:MAG: hypothetical protein FIB07_18140 [Candidatus Methanoperedens sp.]|nr:hypothetical protein [Candidatus Methanoperedens sp.]